MIIEVIFEGYVVHGARAREGAPFLVICFFRGKGTKSVLKFIIVLITNCCLRGASLRIKEISIGLACLAFFALGFTADSRGQDKTKDGDRETKWERYDSDRNGVKYFYDKATISYPSAKIVQVRRQRVFPDDARYRNIVTLDQIDCDKQKYRYVEIKVTNRDGSTEEFAKASEWGYIYVGMPEDYFLREYCK